MSEFTRIKEIIVYHVGCNPEAVTLEANLEDDLGMDSLDAVEVLMVVEDDFGVMLDDDDLEKVKTVGDAVNLIARVTA